jgi:hypothetical protein
VGKDKDLVSRPVFAKVVSGTADVVVGPDQQGLQADPVSA